MHTIAAITCLPRSCTRNKLRTPLGFVVLLEGVEALHLEEALRDFGDDLCNCLFVVVVIVVELVQRVASTATSSLLATTGSGSVALVVLVIII